MSGFDNSQRLQLSNARKRRPLRAGILPAIKATTVVVLPSVLAELIELFTYGERDEFQAKVYPPSQRPLERLLV